MCGRPQLLFISQNLPKRFASSGVARLYHFVRLLCRDFSVTVATYYMPAFDGPADVAALEALGARVEAVPFDYPREGSDRFSPKLPGRVRELLETHDYDVIHLERFWMHLCLADHWDVLCCPVVLDEMDVEYKREERRLSLMDDSTQEADRAAWTVWRRDRETELATCARVSRVIAVTGADRETLLGELPGLDVTVIPTGQDVAWLNADSGAESAFFDRPRGVVFCGDYRHNPNVDAALHLVRDIWPLVRRRIPDATLTLLGGSPPEELRVLHGEQGIEVPGWQDDLRPWYRREKVALAPIRFGSGIKAKIIEAAACGVPVVTTPVGAEGLTLVPGEEFVVAGTPQELAEATCRLLENPALRAAMAARGGDRAREYDWEALYPALRGAYLTLLH